MANVTQIDSGYLTTLRSQLQEMLDSVNAQIRGIGHSNDPTTTGFIYPVNGNLQVQAGTSTFQAAADLNAALKTMGGTVQQQLQWLQKVLTDMISETTHTIQSFDKAESLNSQAATQLQQEFSATISDLSSPPSSGSSGSSSNSNSNSSGNQSPSGNQNPSG